VIWERVWKACLAGGIALILISMVGLGWILMQVAGSLTSEARAGSIPTITQPAPSVLEGLCLEEDSCTPKYHDGRWWLVPDNTDIPDCEDLEGPEGVTYENPCYTFDEDEWRLITSYEPYTYELLTFE
jgi:hypothetical protein